MPLDESPLPSAADPPSTPAPTRKRRRWWSVSVRGLMLFVLIVGGSIGWEVNQVSRMRRAITVLQRPIDVGPKNPWAGLTHHSQSEKPAGSEVEIAFDDEYSEGQYLTTDFARIDEGSPPEATAAFVDLATLCRSVGLIDLAQACSRAARLDPRDDPKAF